MVEDQKLEEIIAQSNLSLRERGEQLLAEANRTGGKDNIAVVLIEPFTNEVEKC
jgi:protein phosphatase